MGLMNLVRRGRHERTGFVLYGEAVRAARDPALYTGLGVPDTLDGRFDMVCLFNALLVHRLTREAEPGPALAQAIFDAMFSDMDINLREMGVGDLGVSRRVKQMWEAFHGRAAAYTAALTSQDRTALEDALRRNVWRGGEAPEDGVAGLARLAEAIHQDLAAQRLDDLARGTVRFTTG